MYELGRGVTQNEAEAVRWLRLAAEKGNADAQYRLGFKYFFFGGVPQNHTEAARWFQLAAEQGNAPAQVMLGFMYDAGRGVPQDYAEAYKWYTLAADAGDADAQMFRATAQQGRDRIMQSMTPAQIAEGQRRSEEWQPTNGPQH